MEGSEPLGTSVRTGQLRKPIGVVKMTNLTILNTQIRTLDGLFSLNDFHKASGENPSQRPSLFIRNNQTKDLILEIEKDQSTNLCLAQKSIKGGLNAGVWACEELVIAYAMWISPAFHLIVLRAFLNLHKNHTALLPTTITPEQQQAIQSAVQQAHHRTGLHWQEIYRQLKAMFHIAKYDQLPQDQFGNAMAFIMNLQPIVLPSVEKKFTFEFTEYELEQLVWLWCGHKQMNTLLGDMIEPLDAIGSRFTGIVISHHQEYQRQYKNTLPTIQRLIEPFKQSDRMNWTRAKNLIAQ